MKSLLILFSPLLFATACVSPQLAKPTSASQCNPTAASARTTPETFNLFIRGQIDAFCYTSDTDQTPRTILYYLPKSVANAAVGSAPVKTLVFLHGGGSHTTNDDGATTVANRYIPDFTQYAEDHQVILLFPTTSIGWNYHTSYFLRNFLAYAKSQLAIDENHLVLAGHSMGGMGITREYPGMTAMFSGVMSLSAGTQSYMLTEDRIVPYLNGTPYTQIDGEDDVDFPEFKPNMLAFQSALEQVEAKEKRQAQFKLIFRPGGHEYVLPQVLTELDNLFQNSRVFYPKFFETNFATLHTPADATNPQGFPALNGVLDQQYWVKLKGFADPGAGQSSRMYLRGDVEGQTITLTPIADTMNPTELELTLTDDLVDLNQPVQVIYNSKVVYQGWVSYAPLRIWL